MTKSQSEDAVKQQIYNNLAEKETDVLLEIWYEQDLDKWSDDAFQAIESILIDRLGDIPKKPAPEGSEDYLRIAEYPMDHKLTIVADLANRISWLVLIFAGIMLIIEIIQAVQGIQYGEPALSILGLVANMVDGLLFKGFIFITLQAISEIIYLLMDIRELSDTSLKNIAGEQNDH